MNGPPPTSASFPLGSRGVGFGTTHWTRVVATRGDGPEAREALAELCADYYEPVVGFLRAEGRTDDEAREVAHAFFERVLERHGLERADPARGRFRSYLLGALKHFLANCRQNARRAKRGGDVPHEAIDAGGEFGGMGGVVDPATEPDGAAFDRAWALGVIERALAVMAREESEAGARMEFDRLAPWLSGDGGETGRSQQSVALELGMSEGAVRVAVHRLRRRFRRIVREEIARTVADPAEVVDELNALIRALGSRPS